MQHRMSRVGFAVVLFAVVTAGTPLVAQEVEVLASFDNPPAWPRGGLTVGPDGLYGAALGGSYDYGSIYRFTPPTGASPASLTKVYSFPDTDYDLNLGQPTYGLVLASDGNFYGVRSGGSWSGYTAVYRVTPAGEQSLFHFFVWPDEGGNPEGPLAELDGALYGTCRWGGDSSLQSSQRRGTVFRLDLDGTMTPLHTFTGGVNGDRPEGGLVVGTDGLLYGTTKWGGEYGYGTIFSVDPAGGVVEILHSFNPASDGSGPAGELTVGSDGALYGAAVSGDDDFNICGTIFRFEPDAAGEPFAVLHTFSCGEGETKYPTGGMVIADGSLFGTTYGASIAPRFGDGVVFRLDLETSDFEILWSHNPDVVVNGALEVAPDGAIYAQSSGPRGDFVSNTGSILRIDPDSGHVDTVYEFGPSDLPRKPFSLVEGEPGELLVVAHEGGATNRGSVFRRARNGAISIVHEFVDGSPFRVGAGAYLTRGSDGLIYGTRSNGGAKGDGNVFALDAEGQFNELYEFDGTYPSTASHPWGALIESRFEPGVFYGTLSGNGLDGGVFEIDAFGNVTFLALVDYLVGSPRGRLVQTENGSLYGVISDWLDISGNRYGAPFRSSPLGGLTRLSPLSLSEGQRPQAGLTARSSDVGTFLYGTALHGGSYDGTVFKLSPTEEIVPVHSFNGNDGSEPLGELVLAGDGRLYGTTSAGGAFGYGTLFAVTSNDEIVTVHHFDHATGAVSRSAPIVGQDGNVYGVTTGGGPGGGGVIFRYNLAPVVTLSEPVEIVEGDGTTLVADAVDPQGGPVTFAWDLDGDGEFDDGDGTSFDFVADAPERDGPGDYPLAVRVTDESGVATVATTVVTVDNVAPTVQVTPADSDAAPGDVVALDVSFTDPGPDTWTATVDWGDGTVDTIDPATSPFTVSHAFSEPGTFIAQISVIDDDGGEGTATATINLGTVEDLIEELIDDVDGLIDDGEINYGRGRSLIAELQVALWFLQWNNGETQAAVRLELFIKKVEVMIKTDQVDPDLGADLIAKANDILDLLRA